MLRTLGKVVGFRNSGGRSLLTSEDFQEELLTLGLSGKEFTPEDYAEALAGYLSIEICLCVFSDEEYPELKRSVARSGRVAEVCYSEDRKTAVVLVPGSLTPLLRTLAIYHELGHLAAGDLVGAGGDEAKTGRTLPTPKRLARVPPLDDERLREKEADLRAHYALLAGSLGLASPYARKFHEPL